MAKLKPRKKRGIFERLVKYYPALSTKLLIAGMSVTPEEFLKKNFISGLVNAAVLTALSSLFLLRANLAGLIPILFVLFFFITFSFSFIKLNVAIFKRKEAIDKEVIYAGRYMLLKLYSGRPLLNTLIEQSKGYGVAAKYVKEIVDDINSGSTIEDSLEKAMKYTPSDKFRSVLFHINNALKYGIDVSTPLESIINEITEERLLDIEKYGKKMNSVMIFYMLFAVVGPSLGITIFIVLAGFVGLSIHIESLLAVNFFIILLQLIFLSMIRIIRPVIDL